MKPIFNTLVGLLVLFSASMLNAQTLTLSFNPAAPSGTVGSNITVDVIANEFNGIAGMQFPILYDKTKLEFQSAIDLTPDLPNFIYGTPPNPSSIANPAGSNKVSVVWFDPSGAPNFLAPNAILFRMVFKVLVAGSSNIYIGNAPPPAINVFGEGNTPATFTYPTGPPVINGFALVMPTEEVQPTDTVCLPVTVNDFTNIVGMQFMVNWNSNYFTFSHVQNFGVNYFDCTKFNPGTPGRLAVNWEDITGIGTTLANGAPLFEVCLIANGPSAATGGVSNVRCDGAGMPQSSPIAIENNTGANVWSASTSSVPGPVTVSNNAVPDDKIVRFLADTLTVAQVGNNATVNIKVKNFKDINAFQFVLEYDPLVLGSGIPAVGTTAPGFTTTLPNGTLPLPVGGPQLKVEAIPGQPGKLKVSWRSLSASSSQTIADGTSIITFIFPTTTASPGSQTRVKIVGLANPATPMQVSQRNFTCTFLPRSNDGYVKISNAPQNATVSLVSKTDVNCFGQNTGAIDINVIGGNTGTYTYVWGTVPPGAFSATTQDISNLQPGTYQVTVTAGNQMASLPTPVVITGPTAGISIPTSSLTVNPVKCFGSANGSISLTPVGGTAPYTYLWTGGATTNNPTNLAAGNYKVTVTDNKGCTFVSPDYTITQPSGPLTASIGQVTNVRCMNDANGSACVTVTNAATGAAPSFAWVRLTPAPSGVQVSTAACPNNLAAGTYTVTVTDANGCTAVPSQIVTVNNPPSALSLPSPTITHPACEGQNNGSICLTPSGGWGNYSYQWATPAPGVGGCPSGVGAGTYSVTVIDGNGCSTATSATLAAQTVAPVVTNQTAIDVSCFNAGNGSISLTLNGTFSSINWTGPNGPAGSGTSISGLGGGNYTAVVSFGTGCTKSIGPINIKNPDPIAITVVNTTQQNGPTGGSADISVAGGTGLLSYSWTGPGGFTASTQDISNLQPGMYTVTVKDVNNCQQIQTVEITSACIICGTNVITTKSCGDDGCIIATVPLGAQAPFVLTWAGAESGTQAFTSGPQLSVCELKAGSYGITITDATNQSYVLVDTVGARPQVQITSTAVNPTQTNKNGSISLSPGPGLPLTYMWVSGNIMSPPNNLNSPVLFNLDSGTYCVKVTNLLPEGCEATYCFDLVQEFPDLVCGTATATNPTCLSTSNGNITLNPQGGNNTYTYSWVGPNGFTATTKNITNLTPGTYSCTVTSGDGQSCVIAPTTLSTLSNLAVSNVNEVSDFNGYQVSGVGVCNGVANVVATGASGSVSYLWSNGVTTASNTSLCGGAYSVIITDQTGCTAVWADELSSPTAAIVTVTPGVEYNGYGVSCNGSCDAIAQVKVSGGVVPYVVKWPGGKTEVLINSSSLSFQDDLCAGEHTVVITDANGIITNFTFDVTEPNAITLTFTDIAPDNLAICNAEIIPQAEGAVGDVTYSWISQFHQGTGLRADDLCADEVLTFTATDENGCTATAQHTAPFPTDACFNANPVLTPNGDGDNDFFKILCIEDYPNTVEIYDRWNQAVTTKFTNYANNWDGKRGGVPVPEGVYFYVVSFVNDLGEPITLKGYFNILY